MQTILTPQPPDDAEDTLSELVWRNRNAQQKPRLLAVDARHPNSATRSNPQPDPVPASQPAPDTEERPHPRSRFLGSRPMWFILLGALIVVALVILIQQVIIPAWGWTQDQWTYGNSRITQMDANVGHDGISHFVALYSHGDIVILEIALDHPTIDHVYTLTGFLNTTGTLVVLLSIADVDHDGKPDLIVQVKGSDFEEVLYNTGSKFTTSEERS